MIIFFVPIIAVIVLVLYYAAEIRANNRRIHQGKPPMRHHDLTDHAAPVDVIDWSRRV